MAPSDVKMMHDKHGQVEEHRRGPGKRDEHLELLGRDFELGACGFHNREVTLKGDQNERRGGADSTHPGEVSGCDELAEVITADPSWVREGFVEDEHGSHSQPDHQISHGQINEQEVHRRPKRTCPQDYPHDQRVPQDVHED